jgi:hypothetical protein
MSGYDYFTRFIVITTPRVFRYSFGKQRRKHILNVYDVRDENFPFDDPHLIVCLMHY